MEDEGDKTCFMTIAFKGNRKIESNDSGLEPPPGIVVPIPVRILIVFRRLPRGLLISLAVDTRQNPPKGRDHSHIRQ